MRNFYITGSSLLDGETREQLERGEAFLVSGQPLNHWSADGCKEWHFENTAAVVDMPFQPSNSAEIEISRVGNNHVPASFIGVYVALTGINPETGDEFRFGVREELGFCLRAISLARFEPVGLIESNQVCMDQM